MARPKKSEKTADRPRNDMDATEYKYVVLALIVLKYAPDTFEEHRAKLSTGKGEYAWANPEGEDEYRSENVLWIPEQARWLYLQANAKQPTFEAEVDDAMVAIERDNVRLKGVLPEDYACSVSIRGFETKHIFGNLPFADSDRFRRDGVPWRFGVPRSLRLMN